MAHQLKELLHEVALQASNTPSETSWVTYYKTIRPGTELAASHCCLVTIIGPGAGLLVYTARDTWRDAPSALQRKRVDLQDTAAQAGHHPAPLQLSEREVLCRFWP